MQVHLESKLGAGSFADIWRGRDEIARPVAVKIVRPDDAFGTQALAHARALAQVDHPNVVKVFSIERVPDPERPENDVTCVVMELIEGETLGNRLSEGTLTADEAASIGRQLVEALRHMTTRMVAHGDLHTENIMLSGTTVKVIDILYLSGTGQLSASSFDKRVRRDLLSLRLVLSELLQSLEHGASAAARFHALLGADADLDGIAGAFDQAAGSPRFVDVEHEVWTALNRMSDSAFVDTPEYAEALAEEIPSEAHGPLLRQIVAQGTCGQPHRAFVTTLWRQLQPSARQGVLEDLQVALDERLPKGRWWPLLHVLAAVGAEGWSGLRTTTRLRTEKLIVNDVLAGHVDIYKPGPSRLKGGQLGTWAQTFYRYFSDRERLVSNLASLLRQSWYTQNYVAEYFMHILASVATSDAQRKLLISALVVAVRNDARIVINRLNLLPAEWSRAVQKETAP